MYQCNPILAKPEDPPLVERSTSAGATPFTWSQGHAARRVDASRLECADAKASQTLAATLVSVVLPEVAFETQDAYAERLTRQGSIEEKHILRRHGGAYYQESKKAPSAFEKNALSKQSRACHAEADFLETHLNLHFIPQHSPAQLLGSRALFVSPLFRVKSNATPRDKLLGLTLSGEASPQIDYVGPELRQSDGRIFLALLNLLRDIQTGTAVRFEPAAVCRAVLGRYDGASRKSLREHIERLADGLLIFEDHSVQLCRKFEHPKAGPWTISLDPNIVELFRASPAVWLKLEDRLLLPEGIATWLLTYIASQTRLIPTKLSTLRQLCGSDASEKAFANRFRDALRELVKRQIIDAGWSVKAGRIHWLKMNGG